MKGAVSFSIVGGAIATLVAWCLGQIGHQPPVEVVTAGQTIWTALLLWGADLYQRRQITPPKP